MRVTTTVKTKGKLRSPVAMIMEKLKDAANEIGEAVMAASKENYLEQRKTNSSAPSMIIQSFDSTPATKRHTEITKTIVAGGQAAPWAVWVNDGHTLRDGTWWEGYSFMEYGIKVGKELTPIIVKQHLNIK